MPDNAYGYIYPLGRPDAALYFDSYPAEYSDELKTHGGAEKVPGRAGDVIQVTGRGSPEFNFDVLFDEMNGPRTVPLAQWPGAHKAWEWLDYWLGDSAEDESDNDNLFVIRLVGGKPRDAWVQRVKRKREYEDDNGRVLRFSADFSGQWVRQTEVDASGFKRPRKARKPKPVTPQKPPPPKTKDIIEPANKVFAAKDVLNDVPVGAGVAGLAVGSSFAQMLNPAARRLALGLATRKGLEEVVVKRAPGWKDAARALSTKLGVTSRGRQ